MDPFTGNATTQIASKGEFRHYIGFEINKNLRETIETNLNAIKEGENYKPYHKRIPSIEELAEKYPKTYVVYKNKLKKVSNIS